MNVSSGPPQFGERVSGVSYIDRPGSYGLVIRDGKLLVVETPAGYFLPGGGIDDGESPEETLQRELLEETGLFAAGIEDVGTARQYGFDSATGIGYNKTERFFRVTAVEQRAQPVELDHTARWVSISEALAGLHEQAQAWAVRQACLSS